MEGRELSLWDKVVLEPADQLEGGVREGSPVDRARSLRSDPAWRWKRRGLDLVGTLLWTYAFLKVFVYDIDRALVEELVPGADWVLDLRFFAIALLVAIAVVALRPRSLLLAALYVALFPLVVLLWKLPRWLIKLESWVTVFALMNAITTVVTNLRYVVVATVLALLAGLAIVASGTSVILAVAAVVIATLLLASFARTILFSLRPSRFIDMQERGISSILDSRAVGSLTTIDDDLRSEEIERFDQTQQQQFLMKVASSAAIHRALYFWAYQLDQYRKSAAGVLYGALSYLWLLVQAVVALTFINAALYKMDTGSFSFDTAPTAVVFARYSFASLVGNEIDALQAHSDLANAVSLGAMFIGFGLLAGLLLTLFLSFRKEKQNAAIESCLQRIGQRGRRLEARHEAAFELSIHETLRKLEELSYALRGMVTFFSSRIPPGWQPGDRS